MSFYINGKFIPIEGCTITSLRSFRRDEYFTADAVYVSKCIFSDQRRVAVFTMYFSKAFASGESIVVDSGELAV